MMIKQTVLLVVVLFGSLFPIHTIMQPPFNANYIEADLVAEVKVTKGKSPSVPEVLKKHHFNICWEIQVQNVIKGDSVIGKKLLLVDKIRSFESYQLDDGGTYIVLLSEPMDADIDVNLQKKNTYMCLVGG
ncbi:MAG: hypothetical protein JNL74_21045, partial [Fibrobacteres bacterium]|nr:hypothetical protein [Fibrobacterota bacterium]